MRERLIDLMIEAKKTEPDEGSFTEWLADYLLANGVIVLPVKVGQTVYGIAQPCGGCKAYNKVMTEEYLKMCKQCDILEKSPIGCRFPNLRKRKAVRNEKV